MTQNSWTSFMYDPFSYYFYVCYLKNQKPQKEEKVSICSISPKFPNSIVYQKFPNIYHSSTGIYYDIVMPLCTCLMAANCALL